MKEYNVELTVNKTFTVPANSIEEAKEKAIKLTRSTLGNYNSLTIEDVTEEPEDLEPLSWENEYDVTIITESGRFIYYGIEADNIEDANMVSKEFFADDYPDEKIRTLEIHLTEE